MSRRLAALSVALEFVIPSAVGAAAAILVAPFATPEFFVLPVVDRAVFGADVTLPGALRIALALCVSLAFGVMSARSVRARDTSSTTELLVGITRRRASGMLFAAGICMALMAWQRAEPRDPVLWVAIVLVSAGLPGAVATASRHLARICGRLESGSPTMLLATRRIMADPRSTTRVASVIGVALLVFLTAQPAADAVKVPPQPWIDEASVASFSKGLAGRAESLANVPFTAVSADRPPAVRLSLPVVGLWAPDASKLDRPSATAVVATCDDLSSFVGRPLEGCSGRPQHVATPDSSPTLAGGHELRSRSRAPNGAVAVPGDVQPVVVPDDALIDAAVILPPSSVPDDVYETGALMVVDPSAESWERARTWVMASNPAGRLENALEASAVRDTTAPWLLLGLATGMAIILAGALLGAIEPSSEHRDRSLRMLGVRPSELTVARTIQGVVTAIPAAVFAGAGAAVLGVAFRSVGGVGPDIAVYIVASSVAGLLTVVVSAISSAASAYGRRR